MLRLEQMMDADTARTPQEQAEHWFARLRAPDCSAQERQAFQRWRQVPAHAHAYDHCERLWQRLGAPDASAHPRLQALRARVHVRTTPADPVDPSGPASEPPSPANSVAVRGTGQGMDQPADQGTGQPSSPRNTTNLQQALAAMPLRHRAQSPRRRRIWPAAAAAAVCAVALGIGGLYVATRPPPPTTYAATDAVRQIPLQDGTSLQLDVGTELAVRYAHNQRHVVLHHGRAVFDVAHDPARPFTVDLGDSQLTVLGTRFQAQRETDRVSVTLDRGALRLDGADNAPVHSERLAPGQQISYAPQTPADWRKRSVDSDAVLAWSRGRLVFRATPLAEAVDQVNRYAHPKLRLADPSLASLPVSGNFLAGDSTLIAQTWAATLPLRSEPANGEIVLHAR